MMPINIINNEVPEDLRGKLYDLAKDFLDIVDESCNRINGPEATDSQRSEVYYLVSLAWHDALTKRILEM